MRCKTFVLVLLLFTFHITNIVAQLAVPNTTKRQLTIPINLLPATETEIPLECDDSGQILLSSVPENVCIVDINNDKWPDAFVYSGKYLELHYGAAYGFSPNHNGFWEFDSEIETIFRDRNRSLMMNKLNIHFQSGETDFLMQWVNKMLLKSEYDAKPEIYQKKTIFPTTINVDNSFQIIWENDTTVFNVYEIFSGDMDKDGKKELMFGSKSQPWGGDFGLHIYENSSDNTFKEVFTVIDTTYAFNIMDITDLDDDGKLELCIFPPNGPNWLFDSQFILYENIGDNNYQRIMIPTFINLGTLNPSYGKWIDSDGNGKSELVVAMHKDISADDSFVYFYENLNPGTFDRLQWWLRIEGQPIHGIDLGDLDYDGFTDIIIGMASFCLGDPIPVHRWEYTGHQSFQKAWIHTGICNGTIFPEIFDFDNDSLPELAFAGGWAGSNGYPGIGTVMYIEGISNENFNLLSFDTTSYLMRSLPMDGTDHYTLNGENYLSIPTEIFPYTGQYFDGYAILFEDNQNYTYPFEPIFYTPIVDSTAIHTTIIEDLDDDSKIELVTEKEYLPARVRIWEENIVKLSNGHSNTPQKFQITAYPNPFNSSIKINYIISISSEISLSVFDILGRRVRKLFTGNQSAGKHIAIWDGKNQHGKIVSSGIYYLRMGAGKHIKTHKVILNR